MNKKILIPLFIGFSTGLFTTSWSQDVGVMICPGDEHVLRVTSPESGVSYTWYRDGVELSTPSSDSVVITDPGAYVVMGVNLAGCQSGLSEPMMVEILAAQTMPDWAVVSRGDSINIEVLANDIEGCSAFDSSSVLIATAALYGTVSISATGVLTYFADPEFVGTDTLTYTVVDGDGHVSTETLVVIEVVDAPLSVARFDLSGELNGKKAHLTWSFISEIEKGYFHIERSDDARTFVGVGHEDLLESELYQYIDENTLTGVFYYRVVVYSEDGRRLSMSNVVQLDIKSDNIIEVFPNPTHHIVMVRSGKGKLISQIELINMHGVVLETVVPTSEQTQLSLESYPSGTYFIRCADSDHQDVQVFQIQKVS